MVFANPTYLYLLLLLIPMVGWYIYKLCKSQASLQVSSTEVFDTPGTGSWKVWLRHVPFVLRIFAVAVLIIILARPQSTNSWQNSSTEGIDIVLAMDISTSMLAQDLKPNRLEASKDVASAFINGRPNDNIGLVVFAAESFTQCPLTTDHAVLINLLNSIQPGIIEDGTAIGLGLANAVNRIKDSQAKSKVIILLTDGSNNRGDIAPLTAAEIAKKFISSENLNKPDSAEWITHSVDWYLRDYRWAFVDRQVKNLFGTSFEDYAEFAILSQIAQAEAFKFHIERMRLNKPKTSGIIWWNLHDGWPQVTEAVIDFYGNKKMAYEVIKRSQKPFTFSVKTDSENRLILVALNDGAKDVSVNYTVVDGETGEEIKSGKAVTVAGKNSELGFINVSAFSQKLLLIKFDGDANGFNHYITGYPTYDKEKVKAWYEIIKNWD